MSVGVKQAQETLRGNEASKITVAINMDEQAPIFQIADYGLIGDLFTTVPELAEKR